MNQSAASGWGGGMKSDTLSSLEPSWWSSLWSTTSFLEKKSPCFGFVALVGFSSVNIATTDNFKLSGEGTEHRGRERLHAETVSECHTYTAI